MHDVGEAQGMPFFVMELVKGPSLSRARPAEIFRIVEKLQIALRLSMHANSIVHRDLKPDNVLFPPGRVWIVKLADLGLALPGYGERISRTGVIWVLHPTWLLNRPWAERLTAAQIFTPRRSTYN